ncbi:MAG TPA: hypothetical protein VFQ78_02465 [Candidatus Udaeobacter sp.]|jgi:hypothetical protein|nr:hypothetical protein [Candidatus Udaeobacter sp.]
MGRYFKNRIFKIGFWLFVMGSGPLLAIIVLAALSLWPDPNPNPIGPGLLCFFTFWPSVICLAIGAVQVWRAGN